MVILDEIDLKIKEFANSSGDFSAKAPENLIVLNSSETSMDEELNKILHGVKKE